MKDLRSIFRNPFRISEAPSIANFRKFSEAHLARISGPNADPALGPLVAPTAQAVQESFTAANNAAIEAYRAGVKRKEAAILAAFPEDSPEYQEFFPQGMTEYRRMTKGNAETLMDRMQAAVLSHAAVLEPGLSAYFKALRIAYTNTRSTQLTRKGINDDLRDDAARLRTELEAQLYKNIHFIAFTFGGDVEKCMTFFDQSMMRGNSAGSHSDTDTDTPVQPL